MSAPELARPETVVEASELLRANEGEAKLIAGGTAVVLMMRQGLIAPALLVSLQRVGGLASIDIDGENVRIGGNVTLHQVATSDVVRSHAPTLARTCEIVGNVRVRNAATLAGNLAEADYASDPPAVLACLDATCTVQDADGARTIPVADLITGFFTTALSPTEIITDVQVPVDSGPLRSAYLKYVSRSSEDRPCLGVAARAAIRGGAVDELKVVVGAVGPTPVSFPSICREAKKKDFDDAAIRFVADAYADAIDAMEDARGSSWYRKEMTRVFVSRTLNELRSAYD